MTDDDPARAFTEALTAAARHHLRAASEHLPPIELGRICSAGIGWNHPANAPSVILFRLRRESRLEDEDASN